MPAVTRPKLPWTYRAASRVRGPASTLGVPLIVLGLAWINFAGDTPSPAVPALLTFAGAALLVVGVPLTLIPLTREQPAAVDVEPPVAGRWLVANSPTDKVPSHGTNGHGQTYAFDVVYDPHDGARPEPEGLGFADPEDYPAFGREVLAAADGTVVAVHDRARDHRCRTTGFAYGLMLAEGMLREAFGSKPMLGNHVTIEIADGVYASAAHLQRGSAAVRVGEHVRAGQVIARCGNSGNSSEPHVHFQLMDRPRPFTAAGIPFAFPRFAGPERPTGIPRNDEHLEVPERAGRFTSREGERVPVGGR
jgi:murein DD-endopeptidase MepM/ murein hydrolase activator NlpD